MTRSDAALKVHGEAEYGMDLVSAGMAWAALVPAPVAHGRIVEVSVRAARSMPGVVAAVGPNELANLLPNGGETERPVFPFNEVMYLHQPLAAVAASSLAEARAAAKAVRVEVEPLEVLTEIDDVFPDWPGPDAARSPHVNAHVHARHGDVEATFGDAELVHSETYRTSGVHQVALEPHACLAHVHDGRWSVRTSTQTPFGVKEDTADILGIPMESIVVDGTWVGGGFGGKGAAFLEPYALVLSAQAGRPVRLALSYREEFLLGRSTLPSVIRLDTAVKGGRITGRRVRLLLDGGSSLPGRDFATGYSIGFLLGPYRCDAFEMEGYSLRTHKPPFGPHRAPFAPQCAFALESHIDGLARRLGRDPIEFRLAHAWREGETTPMGQPVGPFGLVKGLEEAQRLVAAWHRDGPRDHGIGVGVGFWATGVTAGGEAEVTLRPDALTVLVGEREIGSGSVVAGLSAIASTVTGLPSSRIRVEYGDTDHAPYDTGVFGSRTVAALGQAVEKATVSLLALLRRRTGATTDVTLAEEDDRIVVASGRSRTPVAQLFTAEEKQAGGISTHGRHYGTASAIDASRVVDGTFYPYTDFVASVHVARVAVDREVGTVKVIRYAAFQDVGRIVDPAMVTGQVEGGVVMGLGEALTEEMLWSTGGRLKNPGLLDYRVPTLRESPPIEVHPIEGFAGAGPFGAKGLGEPPIIPVPAAVANAVADATGSRVTELPLTPERVARALKLL